MKRKLMSLFLVLALVFGSVSTAFANTEYKNKLERKPLKLISSLELDKRAEGISDNANVRVIVEVEGAPIIENAIKNGVKVDELEKNTYNTLNKKLVDKQNQVKTSIAKAKIKMKYHNSFTNVVNGFSGTTTFKEAKMIQDISGVKKVTIANAYERPVPLMDTSKGIIKATETWNTGLNGQGMLVAIIDTGVDPDHKDMNVTDASKAKLDEAKVDAKGLAGKFFTDKVPYGYNYMDSNNTILDIGPDASEHGMHVAGTVAANGEIQGVAPEAQLLAMKVFGNDPAMPSTFGDVIVKAMDDSVVLGADVINMSLGSTSSFVQPTDPEQMAVTRAVEAGVVCAISAGNSNQMADGYDDTYGYPLAGNPDYGLVGSPGLSTDSLQVASVENTNIKVDALNYEGGKAGYLSAGSFDPVKVFAGKKLGFVDCGLGKVEDFNEKDLNGKIALIMRGTLTFGDKIKNAQGAGAAGVIIYNNKSGGDSMISMAYPEDGKIPAVFVGYTDGNKLLSLIAEAKNFVEFKGEKSTIKNPNTGKMSDFTSWGPTPNLDFKPEITAPGGQIYSTLQNNSYGLMSGTSMAAPHVAGGSALVMQRVNKDFAQLTGRAKAEMVKNLIMSTAKPVNDKYGKTLVSPRRQGAGVMDLYAATKTPAIITEKSTGISKVALKEIGNNVEFDVVVTNYSDKELNYTIDGKVQTDLVDGVLNLTMAQPVLNAPMTFEVNGVKATSLTVPAKGTKELKVKINLTNAVDWNAELPLKETFPNGTFIDGFITLKEATDTEATLNIPYMGFYGDWNKAPIFDKSIYAEDAANGFYGVTSLAWLKVSGGKRSLEFLGFSADGKTVNANNIAFAPNADGYSDSIRPIVSFLRNAKEVEVNILNKDKKVVRRIDSTEYERKNYYAGSFYKTPEDWTWDGNVNDEVVEGQYYYQIKAKIDFEGAEWQTLEFPVKVDMTDPVIEKAEFNKENKTITVTAADNMTDIHRYAIYSIAKDGNLGDVLAVSTTNVLDISSVNNLPYTAIVVAYDYAGNLDLKFINLGEDKVKPYIFVDADELEPFGSIAKRTIPFTGYVVDYAGLRTLKINGESIPFTYNEEKDIFEFSHTLELDRDGVHFVRIEGTDRAGNKIDFERTIYVDTTAPELQIATYPKRIVSKDTDSVTFTVDAGDNSGDYKVLANGSLVYKHTVDWAYVNKYVDTAFKTHTQKDIVVTVPLKYGKNVIRIKAIDSFGNETIKTIEVYRKIF